MASIREIPAQSRFFDRSAFSDGYSESGKRSGGVVLRLIALQTPAGQLMVALYAAVVWLVFLRFSGSSSLLVAFGWVFALCLLIGVYGVWLVDGRIRRWTSSIAVGVGVAVAVGSLTLIVIGAVVDIHRGRWPSGRQFGAITFFAVLGSIGALAAVVVWRRRGSTSAAAVAGRQRLELFIGGADPDWVARLEHRLEAIEAALTVRIEPTPTAAPTPEPHSLTAWWALRPWARR